ncbi:hypothetical protein HanPSC8_Chr15g0677131 [Helianthus annuus]|nr:hypothetical protein HanPSC8_Chr15g0677131 [Helianthus annuus]
MNNLDRPYSHCQLISHIHLKAKTKSKISNFFLPNKTKSSLPFVIHFFAKY